MVYFISFLAYCIGSINFAILIGKWKFGTDIRKHGSGNAGATNSVRVLGKKMGLLVLLGDAGKGALACSLPLLFSFDMHPLYAGCFAVLGHCFPLFAGFKGGKAVATTAGVFLFVDPLLFLCTYVGFVLIVYITKYVFLGSLSIGLLAILYSYMTESSHISLFIIFSILMVFLHRSNIYNFYHKKEPKINDKRIKKDRIQQKKD